MAQEVKNLSTMQETQEMQVRSLGREDPLERGMGGNPLQYSCRKSPVDRAGLQSKGSQELDTTECLSTLNWIEYCSCLKQDRQR